MGVVAVVLLGACAPKEVNYAINIVSQVCDPAVDPFAGVQFIRVKVTGDGIDPPLVADSLKDSTTRQITIPEIPSGKKRAVEVRAYDTDPKAGGTVISMGKSMPFDVPDVVPPDLGGPIGVNVFLRRVNAFTPPSSAATPTVCSQMNVARIGHAATLIAAGSKLGKVFVAGGYNRGSDGGVSRNALADAELFNPGNGTFEKALEMSVSNGVAKLPAAFCTATSLPNGQVLIWGGERYANLGGNPNTVAPTTAVLIYDPDVDQYWAFANHTIARTQHSAAVDKNGKVLIVGGLKGQSQLLDKVEWFDPANNSIKVLDGVTVTQLGGVAVPVRGGDFVAVAGGTDGTRLVAEVKFFKFNGAAFEQQAISMPPRLADPGRRALAAGTLNGGADLVLMGGYSDPSAIKPLDTSEIVSTDRASVASGPAVGKRGELCAVTLLDGRVMAIGGRTTDSTGTGTRSDGTSAFVLSTGAGGAGSVGGPSLAVPRFGHTCTVLLDGTVLVTGGINESGGTQTILSDAFVYQPPPAD